MPTVLCASVCPINSYKICAQKIVYKYPIDLVTLSFGRDIVIYIYIHCIHSYEVVNSFVCVCVCGSESVCMCVCSVVVGFLKKLGVTHILIVLRLFHWHFIEKIFE